VILLGLTAAYLSITISTAWTDSVTVDEVSHLPAGYSYVATGDFRLNIQHPPLVKLLAGLPLRALELKPVEDSPGWDNPQDQVFGRDFLIRNTAPTRSIVFLGRLPMILVGLFLGLCMYWWSRQLWGDRPALVVFGLFAFSPNLLAHARLVTTDVGVAAFTVATVALLWKFSRDGAWRWAWLASAALGCALLTKYNGLVTLAIAVSLVVGDWAIKNFPERDPAHSLRRMLMLLLLLAAVPAVMIALIFDPPHGLSTYITGFNRLYADHNPNVYNYIWGEWSSDAFWNYYLLAQFWKIPIPMLALFFGSLLLVRLRDRRLLTDWMFILLPLAAFHGAGVINSANIGLRHVMPIFPFMMISAGAAVGWLLERKRAGYIALGALAIWYVGGTMAAYPHLLPYFNELAGGTNGGNRYLDDSNIEWGESYYHLSDYLRENPGDARIAGFRPLPPPVFGVVAPQMRVRDMVWPQYGRTYAIGGNILRSNSLINQYSGIRLEWHERGLEPVDRVGSFFIYRFARPEDQDGAAGIDSQVVDRETWYQQSIDQLSRILALNPDYAEGRQLLAEAYFNRASWKTEKRQTREAFLDRYAAAIISSPEDSRTAGYRTSFEASLMARFRNTDSPSDLLVESSDSLDPDSDPNTEGRALWNLVEAARSQPQGHEAREHLIASLEAQGFDGPAQRISESEATDP
jgi:hypothetical protein